MLQLKYNNGSTGIATIESSSLSVLGVDAGNNTQYGSTSRLKKFPFGNFKLLLTDIANIEVILIAIPVD